MELLLIRPINAPDSLFSFKKSVKMRLFLTETPTLHFSAVIEEQRIPETDIVFAITATSQKWLNNFKQMKETINAVLDTYSMDVIRVGVIVFGRDTETIPIQQSLNKNLESAVGKLFPRFGIPDLDNALKEARRLFKDGGRSNARKVIVVISDRASDSSYDDLKGEADRLKEDDILLVSVVIGQEANANELTDFTPHNVTEATVEEDPKELAMKIMVLVLTGEAIIVGTSIQQTRWRRSPKKKVYEIEL